MKLTCDILETLKAEFAGLWHCKLMGNTVEIVTPYAMPNSKFCSLYLTERDGRYIACEGGTVLALVREFSDRTEADILEDLRAIAKGHEIKEGSDSEGSPIFFKDCTETKLIGSISFDVINFATLAAIVLTHIERSP